MSTVATTPSHADQLRLQLRAGNEVRRARADFRRRLVELGRDGPALRAAIVLLSRPPAWALTWKVYGLLSAIPGVGPQRIYRALNASLIPDGRVIGALSDAQRHALCLWLEQRASGRSTEGDG